MRFSIFRNINRFAGQSKLLDFVAIFFARIFPYLLVIFLFFYLINEKNFYLFICAILSGLFARFVINEIVHIFYKKPRPAGLKETKVLISVPRNYSFPSGHASFFFGISFFLFFYSTWLSVIFIIFSCLIGVARVFSGVHWFRDIIAGAVAGGISAIIVHQLLNYL